MHLACPYASIIWIRFIEFSWLKSQAIKVAAPRHKNFFYSYIKKQGDFISF